MKILVGDTRSRKNIARLSGLRWGRMAIDRPFRPYSFEPWGFDNGAFVCWLQGRDFDSSTYEKRLDAALRCGSDPILAVVPDIVAGGIRSLDFSLSWIMRLPHGWRWLLAVQDGMPVDAVENCLHLFDGIFLGGTDKFKWTADRWCRLAHAHQKWFHYGRAGTPKKVVHAKKIGADSLDSAFPLWTNERFQKFEKIVAHESTQGEIVFGRC